MEISIYEYRDYRAFLRDFYQQSKKRGFSYRAFSRRAGLSSPNYLKLVIEGERNLSQTMAERFASACGLDDEQARFFTTLVEHNQAKDSEDKLRAEQQLYAFARFRKVHRLRSELTDYYTTWYVPVVRELASRSDFERDPKWVARQVRPRISVSQARKALSILERTGMLVEQDGRWTQADPLVTTPHEIPLPAVAAFHRAMMGMASQAIDTVAREERDISSVTMCVSRKQLPEIKERIQAFRRELLKLSAAGEHDPEQVVQLNMQFFPLSKAKSDEQTTQEVSDDDT